MSIAVHIQRKLVAGAREFSLDICLESSAKRIALFGPSGSGKTLTMQAVAGLLRPDRGSIVINGKQFYDSAQGIWLGPRQRRIAYLFQDYGLFPHLTVAQNVAFGLTSRWFNPRRGAVPPAAAHWMASFELDAVANSYPAEISGGQKQRVALARALATEPDMLLLDEPLAALDAGLRTKMRRRLAVLQHQLDIPTIIITHDPADVLELADEVFQIQNGGIIGSCSPLALSSSA
ncbi:MAG TPA: ATP-binding cassette domain-containing protein [Candidimonas sp.]|nr:ATP-binding cassette domain-containing protein [Candidimonas sp.]